MTNLMQLYQSGVITYLVKSRVVSPTMMSYIRYYEEFHKLKAQGKTYRESIRVLSQQNHVSETTVKKGVRLVTAAMRESLQSQEVQLETLKLANVA